MSNCEQDIIFNTENVGSYERPQLEARVSCNGAGRLDCGFSVQFSDDEGDCHHPHDFWVTGADVRRYEAMHRNHE